MNIGITDDVYGDVKKSLHIHNSRIYISNIDVQ